MSLNVPSITPLSKNALVTLQKRYLFEGETPEDLFILVAKNIATAESL